MRVLLATDSDIYPYAVGGVERFVWFLAYHMTELGASVEVVCERQEAGGAVASPERRFELTRLEGPGGSPPIVGRYRFSRLAARYIREREDSFDVVYGHRDALWAYVPGRRLPCLTNFHGMENWGEWRWWRKLRGLPSRVVESRRIVPGVDRVVSLGGRLTSTLVNRLGVPASKVAEIPNGVDLDLIDGSRPSSAVGGDRRTWLFVGRLSYNKGLGVLIRAFRLAAPSGVRLVIAGDGPLRTRLEAMADGLDVRFAGRISDQELFSLYHTSEAFVFPTENEGMPTVILEAMACGLPVIASDIGAVSTMVTPENGRMVRPGDVDGLANAMTWLAGLSLDETRALGEASRAKVESQFTWKHVARKTLELCERVVTDRPLGTLRT